MLEAVSLVTSHLVLPLVLAFVFADCIRKKKRHNERCQHVSSSEPHVCHSRRCNTHGGLLADDPDLKSLQLRTPLQQSTVGGVGGATNTFTAPEHKDRSKEEKKDEKKMKPSMESTDLRSFENVSGNKNTQIGGAQTAVTQLGAETAAGGTAMSLYGAKGPASCDPATATPARLGEKEKTGKTGRHKTMASRERDHLPQDDTQNDTVRNADPGTPKKDSVTGRSSSKKSPSAPENGGNMDKTQSDPEGRTVVGGPIKRTRNSIAETQMSFLIRPSRDKCSKEAHKEPKDSGGGVGVGRVSSRPK